MSSAIISKSKFVIFLVHDTSARRRIQHQTLFYAGYIQPGTLHHIRVDGYIVNAALYEEFRKVGIYGRRLSTDGYGLAVSVRHFDQVADSPLDGQITFIKERSYGIIISVASQNKHS